MAIFPVTLPTVLVMNRILALMTIRRPAPLSIPMVGMLAPPTVLRLMSEALPIIKCRWAA